LLLAKSLDRDSRYCRTSKKKQL